MVALTTPVIPMMTLLAFSPGASRAGEAFRAECSRVYNEEACACAATRIAQALGPLALVQAAGLLAPVQSAGPLPQMPAADPVRPGVLINPRTRATAVAVVQSCMAEGNGVAD